MKKRPARGSVSKRSGLRKPQRVSSRAHGSSLNYSKKGLQVVVIGLAMVAFCWWLIASLAFPILFQFFSTTGVVTILAGLDETQTDTSQVVIAYLTDSEQTSRTYRVMLEPQQVSLLRAAQSTSEKRATLSHLLGLSVTSLLEMPSPGAFELIKSGQWRELKHQYLLWRLADRDGMPELTTQQVVQRVAPFSYVSSQCAIGVTNTSDVAGAAGRLATFLSNQGAAVVRITSRDTQVSNVTILLDRDHVAACQSAVPLVAAAFTEDVEIVIQPELLSKYRANMVVLVSEAAASQLVNYYSSE